MKLLKVTFFVCALFVMAIAFSSLSIAYVVTDVVVDDSVADEGTWASPWQFNVNIYGWLPQAPVEIYVDDHEVSNMPESLDNILDSLEMTAMFEVEAHKGPIGFFASPVYYKGEYDEHFTGAAGERRKFSFEEKAWIVKYGVSYDIGPWHLSGKGSYPELILQPYAGALYLHDNIELGVDPGLIDNGIDKKTTLKFNTPLIGINTLFNLSRLWSLRMGANYGGAGINDVHKTYELMGTAGYHFKMWDVSSIVFAGYRYLHVDYKKSGIELDVDVKGPLMGIGWTF